jgi:DNA-binding response OmpR family regulator
MRAVLLVGFEHLLGSENLGAGPQVELLHVADLKEALQLIKSRLPELVLVPAVAEKNVSEGFPQLIRRQVPEFRSTVIVVATNRRDNELTIHEWDAPQGAYTKRWSSIVNLKQEVQAILRRSEEARAAKERIRDIGFYDCVKRDGRTLHVQTEVIWRDRIVVQSTVIEAGEVRHTAAIPHLSLPDDLQQAEQVVRQQHLEVVDEVNQGKHG